MNKPYLIVGKNLIGGAILDRISGSIELGQPEGYTNPNLVAIPVIGLDIPDGPYFGYIQLGVSHDELTLKADRHHPSLRFSQPAYGPVEIIDEPMAKVI